MKNADGDGKNQTESDPTPTAGNNNEIMIAVSVVPPAKKRKTEELATSTSSTTSNPRNAANAEASSSQDDAPPAASSSSKGRPAKASRKGAGKSGQNNPGGGRVRLPDKLLKHLNGDPMPDVFWWMPGGDGFAYNIGRVQAEFLDVHFSGTKLASFVRSLNRWGFRRVFYHALPEHVIAFYHPKFKRSNPERVKEISMTATTPQPADGEPNVEANVEEVVSPSGSFDLPTTASQGQQQAALLSTQIAAGHQQPAQAADVMGMLQQRMTLQQSNALAALFHQNLNSLATLQQVQPQQQQQQQFAQQAQQQTNAIQQLQQLSQHQANLAQPNHVSQLHLQLLIQASQQAQGIPGQTQQQQPHIMQQQIIQAGGLQGLGVQSQANFLQAAFPQQGLAQGLLVQQAPPRPPGEPELPQEKEPN